MQLLAVVILLLAVCSEVPAQSTTCWNNQKLVIPNRSSTSLRPYGCYFYQNAYKFAWNFTVQSVNTDTYYVEMGDSLCQSDPWTDNFNIQVAKKYQGNFVNTATTTFSPYYYSYNPTLLVRCSNSIQTCQIQLSACVTVYSTSYCFPS